MPLEEVQGKIDRLKLDNNILRDATHASSAELTGMKAELEFFPRPYEILPPGSNSETSIQHLPNEIFSAIFMRVLLPSSLVDCAQSFVPNSLWCQMMTQKLSLVYVCRAWYLVGLQFLYEDISIRRIPQLASLLLCLQNSSYRDLVKTINIHCFVPDAASHYFQQYLTRLLAICPKLIAFSHTSQCPLPQSMSLPILPSSITHLRLDNIESYSTLENILKSTSSNLESLWISILNISLPPEPETDILFPQLHVLTCLPFWNIYLRPERFNRLLSRWNMPNLMHFSYRLYTNNTESWDENPLVDFCIRYGSGLRSLAIYPSYFSIKRRIDPSDRQSGFNMQILLDLCPNLKHIVLHPMTSIHLQHKTVEWVDIWESPFDITRDVHWNGLRSMMSRRAFPSMKGVRIFSRSSSNIINIHLDIPPQLVQMSTDTFSIEFLQFELRHDVGIVSLPSPTWGSEFDELQSINIDDGIFDTLNSNTTFSDHSESDSENDGSESDVGSDPNFSDVQSDSDSDLDSETGNEDSDYQNSHSESTSDEPESWVIDVELLGRSL